MIRYLKEGEREAEDFAVVSGAAVLTLMDRRHLLALKRQSKARVSCWDQLPRCPTGPGR